ncbi:uncharacterized protein LOC118180292 [Stegodyphus dumicola]|uniref:uncharacterized protein LOC118180292 n=1 Tax=Stegodyphus dumicola TaxID=202533 RepID=UPI0015B32C71|nr:uncharacterized protein LOC118180292 [Stegodyphus dumicola]
MRFREKAIGVTSDIRRAFLQIEVEREDQNYLKFLWWVNNRIEVFRHKRVVFGLTSIPYLLAAVISFHLSHFSSEFKAVANKLAKSFYVDNCVTSVDDNEELKVFMSQSITIMAEAKMDLRMWTFNQYGDQELAAKDSDPVSAVLGLQWDRRDDSLTISVQREIVKRDLSKRRLLSVIHAVFEPLGFFVPVILPAKLILQNAWATKSIWDKPLPDKLQTDLRDVAISITRASIRFCVVRFGSSVSSVFSDVLLLTSSESANERVISR